MAHSAVVAKFVVPVWNVPAGVSSELLKVKQKEKWSRRIHCKPKPESRQAGEQRGNLSRYSCIWPAPLVVPSVRPVKVRIAR